MDQTELLNTRYILEKELGRGGCAISWLAHPRTGTQDKLVIKELQLEKLESWQDLDQFETEARLLEHLNHPHIPDFVEFLSEETPQGKRLYLVQEWIDGQDLDSLIRGGKYFTEAETVAIARTVCQVLVYLHGFSPPIIHRDLKPSNLMLRAQDQRVYLIDFGAVRGPAQAGSTGLTVTGTFGYMPIEQLEGRAVPASDLYALGMTLIHLLARQDPVNLPREGLKLVFRPYVNISPRFARVLEKLIEADLTQRYQQAQDVLADLEALAHPEPPPSAGSSPPASPKAASGGTWKFLLLAAALLTGLGLLGLRTPRKPMPTASPTASRQLESAQDYRSLANDFYDADKYEESLKYFNKLLAVDPSDAPSLFRRGYCHLRLGHYRAGIADFMAAQQIDPRIEIDATWFNIGYCYFQLDHNDEALKAFAHQLQLTPDNQSTYNYIGLIHIEAGRYPQARDALEKALALEPRDYYALANRGRLNALTGKQTQALIDLETAIKLAPSYALPYYYKAELEVSQGKFQLAQASYDRAIQAKPDPLYLLGRGQLYKRLKNCQAALIDFRSACSQGQQKACQQTCP